MAQRKLNRCGFTLIEVIVVAAIIAVLAGVLVPMIFNQIDEVRGTRAAGDCKVIQTAIFSFRKDTGKWPYHLPGDCTQTYLTLQSGTGNDPANPTADWQIGLNPVAVGVILNLPNLNPPIPQTCYNDRAKSYLIEDKPDPWGNKYLVNAVNFPDDTKPLWIISAGANGCLDTTVDSQTLNNAPCTAGPADDVGIRLK